ncbi:MAG: membrane protein insertase YidC [Elusimicrobia bacterium]|nr:membrane protein insertase YidC [Elusimicrobiota bacterium]
MQKNTFLAIFLSTLFLIVWWTYFQPKPAKVPVVPRTEVPAEQAIDIRKLGESPKISKEVLLENIATPEKEIIVETKKYRVVFTNRGAAIKSWIIKEINGNLVDLVLGKNSSVMATFPGSNYTVSQPEPFKIVFKHTSPQGWEIVKTYNLSKEYLHNLTIELKKIKKSAKLPYISVGWGPGLGTDYKELKENTGLIRVLGYTIAKPPKLEKLKNGEHSGTFYEWTAIDNRYFLAAFIPENGKGFPNIEVYKENKNSPLGINLFSTPKPDSLKEEFSVNYYVGPKEYNMLKSFNLKLEETVDFGFFGFLGKGVLYVLHFIKNITNNFGWAIIILTVIMQIIVAPLTIKSFKASAAMKQLQPHIKELQDKYKNDSKRLNAEVLNLYKTQKVNPLGGCLPMILQLPIFWALFTTLRNAYELRGANWILWVKDLSAPDSVAAFGSFNLNILPLIMGIGMFLQQKMMTVQTDQMQARMMYMMPVIFTFMFWGFPSGLVIYWLTNSVLTMLEQYFIMKGMDSPR